MKLTLESQNPKLLALIEELARQLGIKVTSQSNEVKKEVKKTSRKRNEKLYHLMKEKAERGGVSSIKDPQKWQQEVREDKALYGRDEE